VTGSRSCASSRISRSVRARLESEGRFRRLDMRGLPQERRITRQAVPPPATSPAPRPHPRRAPPAGSDGPAPGRLATAWRSWRPSALSNSREIARRPQPVCDRLAAVAEIGLVFKFGVGLLLPHPIDAPVQPPANDALPTTIECRQQVRETGNVFRPPLMNGRPPSVVDPTDCAKLVDDILQASVQIGANRPFNMSRRPEAPGRLRKMPPQRLSALPQNRRHERSSSLPEHYMRRAEMTASLAVTACCGVRRAPLG